MNKAMTWIRKYILNRIVSYALCLLGVILTFDIVIDNTNYSLDDYVIALIFFIPPVYYLAYVHYLNRKLGNWLKCFQAILLLGAAGSWIFLIFVIIEDGLPDIDDFVIFYFIYLLLFPTAFLEAFFGKSVLSKKRFITFLKFFLKKIVWVPIASIVSFAVVWTLILMVSIGGFQNLKERAHLETQIFLILINYDKYNASCNDSDLMNEYFSKQEHYREYFYEQMFGGWDYLDVPKREALDRRDPDVLKESLKKAKSFLPFYKGDPKAQVQQAYLTYDKKNFSGDFCKRLRWIMRASHQGDMMSKAYLSINFYAYSELTDKDFSAMDLNNPLLAYEYAKHLNEDIRWYNPDKDAVIEPDSELLRYVEQSANAGFLPAMRSLARIYSHGIHFNKENCAKKIKMHEDLAEKNSPTDNHALIKAYTGILSGYPDATSIYRCLDEKPNFAKAFPLITKNKYYKNSWQLSFYEALFYLNGWSINQDYEKAYELFGECMKEDEGTNRAFCEKYQSYMILKGLGTPQDEELGKKIFIKDLDGVSCNGETFDSSIIDLIVYNDDPELKEKQEKSKIMKAINARVLQCIKDADRETLLAIVEAHIRNQLMEFFDNEELLATLNVMGEPQ